MTKMAIMFLKRIQHSAIKILWYEFFKFIIFKVCHKIFTVKNKYIKQNPYIIDKERIKFIAHDFKSSILNL